MKVVAFFFILTWMHIVSAEGESDFKIDPTQKSKISTKKFDLSSLGKKTFSYTENKIAKSRFFTRESKLSSKQKATGLNKRLSVQMSDMSKTFPISKSSPFFKENQYLDVQERFKFHKSAPYSKNQLSQYTQKKSEFDGRRYQGKELSLIRKHLESLKKELDSGKVSDETGLSVEQIHEILNQN